MKRVSILGCGWLGFPLGSYLVSRNYNVSGSTTDKNKISLLADNSIKPFLLTINPEVSGKSLDEFFETDILIINFPPERRDDIVRYHKKQIVNLINQIENYGITKVIFASSTSVYPNTNSVVSENDNLTPEKNSGKALASVEKLLLENNSFNTTVIRFAGLVGYDRSPLRSIRQKKMVLNSSAPLNLIHRDDCINIIFEIIKQNKWNEVLNACCDFHPTRKAYYSREAEKNDITLPEFDDQITLKYKIVSNQKLKSLLNYKFKYPDPLKF